MIDLVEEANMGASQEIRIKVMGVGGGGCHVLYRLTQDHVQNVGLVAVNTDEDVVTMMAKYGATGIQIGEKLTHGNGAGGKVEIGEQAAEEAAGQIEDALKEADLVFLVSCLGGGTETGAAPVVARIAKELGVLSIGIVTTPFRFEGRRKLRQAEEAIRKMCGQLDALIVINNDNMLKLSKDKNLSIHDAFSLDSRLNMTRQAPLHQELHKAQPVSSIARQFSVYGSYPQSIPRHLVYPAPAASYTFCINLLLSSYGLDRKLKSAQQKQRTACHPGSSPILPATVSC